jgi:hypothetical protein
MAKVLIKTTFKDKFDTSLLYRVGQEVEFDDTERVKDLASRGLVEELKDDPKAEVAETIEAEKVEAVDTPKPKGRPKANTQ